MPPQKNIMLTEAEDDILERVMQRDRQYFRDHPGELTYERDFVPGEVPRAALAFGKRYRVLVTYFSPERRARTLCEMPPDPLAVSTRQRARN